MLLNADPNPNPNPDPNPSPDPAQALLRATGAHELHGSAREV